MNSKLKPTALVGVVSAAIIINFFGIASFAANISELKNRLAKNPNATTTREALGEAYVKQKQYQKAIELLAPYSNEVSLKGLDLLAKSYAAINDRLNEIRTLIALTERDSHHFRPHYKLGLAYKKDQKYTEAAESFRQSIKIAPQHRPSYDALLEIFFENKQNYESRVLLNDMITQFGKKPEFLNKLCKLYADDGFLTEALSTCKRAVSTNPEWPDNHIYLAQTYYNQNNKSAADRIFKTAGRQFDKSEFAQYATGEYYLNDKNFSAAVRYLRNAVKLNNKSLRARFTLARALYETSDFKGSLENFEAACLLDKSKETLTELRTTAAKLRQKKLLADAELFERKAAVCQH